MAFVLAVPGAIVAAVPLGIVGLVRTRNRARRGRGLAVSGLVVSGLWTLVLAMVAGAAMMLLIQQSGETATPPAAASGVTPSPTPVDSAPPSATPAPSTAAPTPRPVRPKKVRIKDIRIGHCIDREPTGTFETLPVVPCAQPHDVEVFAIRSLSAGRWPGDQAVSERADKACRPAFQAYVGVSYDESTLEMSWYMPTKSAWQAGDRGVTCVLRDPTGRLGATMRGRGV